MSESTANIEQLAINTIRTLSMDGVQAANSGHPGTPMALAPVTYVLWNEVMNYDPAESNWPARDRFVLSCGHASMLQYSIMHLAGIKAVDPAGNVMTNSPLHSTVFAISASCTARVPVIRNSERQGNRDDDRSARPELVPARNGDCRKWQCRHDQGETSLFDEYLCDL